MCSFYCPLFPQFKFNIVPLVTVAMMDRKDDGPIFSPLENQDNSIMDILDILLKPPQPLMELFFTSSTTFF